MITVQIGDQDNNLVLVREYSRDWIIHPDRIEQPISSTWSHSPEPRPGEIFSSYFTRAAKANFAEPLKVLSILDPVVNKANGDLDRAIRTEILQKIAQALGRECRDLEGLCVGGIFRNQMILGGSRYCPFCLQEDGHTPYFRYAWRLNFISTCPSHGCLLEDRCPHCGALVQYWKTKFDQSMIVCYECGKSLLNACRQVTPIRLECRSDSTFNTFQETLLNKFIVDRSKGRVIRGEKFLQKFWRLAWAIHKFGVDGKIDPGASVGTCLSFMKETSYSTADSFKAIFPAFQVLVAFPGRLEKPFLCPIDGRRFSKISCYLRHRHAHTVFSGSKGLCNGHIEVVAGNQLDQPPAFEPVIKEVTRFLQRLSLPQRYPSWILADIASFLTKVPLEFFLRATSCNHIKVLATGLTWALGRFYGITQKMLGVVLGINKKAIFGIVEAFKTFTNKLGVTLPNLPSSTWVGNILEEVHERFLLLSPEELKELMQAVSTLDFPGDESHFFKRVRIFGEFVYAYWVKSLGRTVTRPPKMVSIPPSFAKLRRQLATRVMPTRVKLIQTQIEKAITRIVGDGGFDPAVCAPLSPIQAFWIFLQARCPHWQAYTFTNLVAFLFSFVETKNPEFNISIFSGYLGLWPSTVCTNLKKFGLKHAHPRPRKEINPVSPPHHTGIIPL